MVFSCQTLLTYSRILSANGLLPKGQRLVVGKNTTIYLWNNESHAETRFNIHRSTLSRAVTKVLPMKGLVLSGGCGSWSRPLTRTGPNQLIPMANKPNIEYCIEDLRDAEIAGMGIILGNVISEKIQGFLGDGSRFGVRLNCIAQ